MLLPLHQAPIQHALERKMCEIRPNSSDTMLWHSVGTSLQVNLFFALKQQQQSFKNLRGEKQDR
jgi:hypothetical protein